MDSQAKNKPVLRFLEFTEKWQERNLKEIARSISSGKTKQEADGDYFVYGSTGKLGLSKYFTHNGTFILIARVGANAGLLNIVTDKFAVTDNTLIFDCNEKNTIKFIYYLLIRTNLNKLVFGSGQPLITGGQLLSLKTAVPGLPEQQKIATFLSAVDEKIRQLSRKKELLTKYKKGVMQQIFDQKIRFKDAEGNKFQDWTTTRLGDFYKNLSTGMTPSRTKREYFAGKVPWITSGELNFNLIEDTREKITEEAVRDTNLKVYPPGTLFIAITGLEAPGTRGKCAINAVSAGTNQSCMAFVENASIHTKFLYYWYLQFGIPLYFKFAQGTKQQSFNNKIVEDFLLILPTKPEQEKIAGFLTTIDKKIDLANTQLEKTKTFKKGLLQQMFV